MVDFAICHHVAHQLQRFRCDAEIAKPRHETRHAQDAHRVFDECVADVAHYPRLDIRHAAVRVDQRAVVSLCDGVDGQVTARQILFQCDFWRGVDDETLVARCGFALGARQRVFSVGFRVQEYREILADRLVAKRGHVFRRSADHDVIAVFDRQAEQRVAHCPAYRVDFHGI
jgi:hypothetical protein